MVQLVKVRPHPERRDLFLNESDGEITESDKETVNQILLKELKLINIRRSS